MDAAEQLYNRFEVIRSNLEYDYYLGIENAYNKEIYEYRYLPVLRNKARIQAKEVLDDFLANKAITEDTKHNAISIVKEEYNEIESLLVPVFQKILGNALTSLSGGTAVVSTYYDTDLMNIWKERHYMTHLNISSELGDWFKNFIFKETTSPRRDITLEEGVKRAIPRLIDVVRWAEKEVPDKNFYSEMLDVLWYDIFLMDEYKDYKEADRLPEFYERVAQRVEQAKSVINTEDMKRGLKEPYHRLIYHRGQRKK